MSRPTWTGRRVTAALAFVLRQHGDTCWLCHHHGADSLDHIHPVNTHPHLEWEPTNWRPAHLRKHTHPQGCAVPGCQCPGNAGRGSKAWTAPPSRTWALVGPVLALALDNAGALRLPFLCLSGCAACLLAFGAWRTLRVGLRVTLPLVGGATGEPTGSRPRAIGAGRPGLVRSALARAVREARDDGRMTAEHEVRALLAERVAATVDDATRRGDEAAMLRASDKLLELLDTLPIRTARGGDDVDRSDRGRVLALIDSGPTVGDGADV